MVLAPLPFFMVTFLLIVIGFPAVQGFGMSVHLMHQFNNEICKPRGMEATLVGWQAQLACKSVTESSALHPPNHSPADHGSDSTVSSLPN